MARPSKAAEVIEKEGKSHRTKAELEQRKEAEKAALTGMSIRESQEVSENPVSHEEFIRVCSLLTAVGKNDAMYEAVINDYCAYKSKIAEYQNDLECINRQLDDVANSEIEFPLKVKQLVEIRKQKLDYDKLLEVYRKRRFDIEKENGMTVASSLRSIPKVPAKKNPLLDVLNDGPD